jgi:hypothetical protein
LTEDKDRSAQRKTAMWSKKTHVSSVVTVFDPNELFFTKTRKKQRVRYKPCPEGKRGAASPQRV